MAFPFIKQPDAMDCGPACLGMVSKYYGKDYTLDFLRNKSFIGHDGVSLLGISKAAEIIGFHTVAGKIAFDKMVEKVSFPCIVHWNQEHFVVLHTITTLSITCRHLTEPIQNKCFLLDKLPSYNFFQSADAIVYIPNKSVLNRFLGSIGIKK